tara:strand:- start:25 stop:183 length:159 start_codon:yes stop_codon:yes gene_type:complete
MFIKINIKYLDPFQGFSTSRELLYKDFLTFFCNIHVLFLSAISRSQSDVMDP